MPYSLSRRAAYRVRYGAPTTGFTGQKALLSRHNRLHCRHKFTEGRSVRLVAAPKGFPSTSKQGGHLTRSRRIAKSGDYGLDLAIQAERGKVLHLTSPRLEVL